jgi:hypothetical protein
MKHTTSSYAGAFLLLAGLTGCDQASKVVGPPEVPSDAELQKISYMTMADGSQGRKTYTQLWEARTCSDLETAMRWNRPPNVAGGSFGKRLVYLTNTIPADLKDESEVFIVASIEKGDPLVAGGEVWLLKMRDGSLAQAAETADFLTQQEAQTAGSPNQAALTKPNKPGRAFCGHGAFQGVRGKDPMQEEKKIPLFSMFYTIDRDK